MNIFLKYFIAWFPMLLLAIANGTLRDLVYKKYAGDLAAHQISTVILLILFGIYIAFIVSKYPPPSGTTALLLGLFWMILTIGFEFGFGRYRGTPWEKLLADYNILKGRIWILVPACLLLAPRIFFWLLHKRF